MVPNGVSFEEGMPPGASRPSVPSIAELHAELVSALKVRVRMLEAERQGLQDSFFDAEETWRRREAELIDRIELQALEMRELRARVAVAASETCSTHGSVSELEPRELCDVAVPKVPRLPLEPTDLERSCSDCALHLQALSLDAAPASSRVSPLQAPCDIRDTFAFPLSCSSCGGSSDSPFQSARLQVCEPPRLVSAGLREVRSTTPIQIVYLSPGASVMSAADVADRREPQHTDAARLPTRDTQREGKTQAKVSSKAPAAKKRLRKTGIGCQSSRELGVRVVASQSSRSIHKVSTPSILSGERREARARPSSRTERGSSAPPLASRSPRSSRSCSPSERPGVASQRAEFLRLHNEVAMECMRRPQDLPEAFQHFVGANELHVRTHGFPSSEAVYNQACCLARGAASAAEAFATGATDPAAGLPPKHSDPEGLAEKRLDLAVATLDAAITAGYHDDTNLLHDSDLEYLRERRPVRFAHILLRAQDPICRGHCELVGEVPAPAGAVARCLPATNTSSRRQQLMRATLPRRHR